MKNTSNIEILQKYFNFLITGIGFKLKDVESYDYALYAKLISANVGVYFIYEFRDFVPQLQFTILNDENLKVRPGLYTIKELYKNEDFKLTSFYLDEILLYKGYDDYKRYFDNSKTIGEAIKICAELTELYAMEFLKGDEMSYDAVDKWYRKEVM